MNIFIEGLQGMGKSTLLQKLSEKYPDHHVYREGDYCPIELAWCSYMTEEEYIAAMERYPSLAGEIQRWTTREETGPGGVCQEGECEPAVSCQEGEGAPAASWQEGERAPAASCQEGECAPAASWQEGECAPAVSRQESVCIHSGSVRHIVQYTRILTDEPGFHQYMAQFEIYNGRKTLEEFRDIILTRYRNLPTENAGNLFECAFLQNILEELILYQQLSDSQVLTFYRELTALIPKKEFRLVYLYGEDIEAAIRHISRERSDAQGNPFWYPLMMEYLKDSPYGKAHHLKEFGDLIEHFRHRQELEMQIMKLLPERNVVILPSKRYTDEELRKI